MPKTNATFFASVPRNLEPYLAKELSALGAQSVRPVVSGVEFSGDLAMAYKACLWSRVANRVLLPIASGATRTPEALYDFIQTINWSEHLDETQTLAVDFFCAKSDITHSHYGALKVKDAVVDQFRTATGVRPSVDREAPAVRINVYLFRNRARVSIDLSGSSLHRRGYRADGSIAPLKENLAAALLLAADWPGIAANGGSFYDPLCGSGTLLIEAAMIASQTAPGLLRDYFGFVGWKQHDADLWNGLFAEAQAASDKGKQRMTIIGGSDNSERSLEAARANIALAGFSNLVQVSQMSIGHLTLPDDMPPGLVVTNPPYGVRVESQETLGPLYSEIGSLLRRGFQGWQVCVFTGAPGLMHRMRLATTAVLEVNNGDIACKFFSAVVKQDENSNQSSVAAPQLTPAIDEKSATTDNSMFANRLRKNLRHLRNWVKKESVTAWRVYDADMPEYAVAVDIYDSQDRHIVVQEYQAPSRVSEQKAAQRLSLVLKTLPDVLNCEPEHVHLKVRKRQKGVDQYQPVSRQRAEYEISEYGYRLLVNFEDYLDTGVFLDHRKIRQYIAGNAAGKRFLNLFAYTGSATVAAATGGAASTLTLDLSNTYLDWAERNLHLNQIIDTHKIQRPPRAPEDQQRLAANPWNKVTGKTDSNIDTHKSPRQQSTPETDSQESNAARHILQRVDCLEWLQAPASDQRFDLILLDPPTFSNSARMEGDWDVQRDHASVVHQAMALLAKDGLLIFSNNFRRFKLDPALQQEFQVEDRSSWSLDRDFQRNSKIHRCWFVRHGSQAGADG